MVREAGDFLITCLDFENFYTLVHCIYLNNEEYTLEFLLVLINSKSATNIYRILNDIKGKVFAKMSLDNLSFFPIPKCIENDRNLLGSFAINQVKLKNDLKNSSEKFQRTIQRKFNLIELFTKLESWYLLDYKWFMVELAKKNKTKPYPTKPNGKSISWQNRKKYKQ